MIDLATAKLITFSQAARLYPGRDGRARNVSTIYRWATKGMRGVRLDYVQVGGARYTTREAIDGFIRALTNQSTPPQATATPRSPDRREREARAAERRLDAAAWA